MKAPPATPEVVTPAPPAEVPVAVTGPSGTLSISSRPVGLDVYVDGQLVGKTILRNVKVGAGSHKVTIRNTDGTEYNKSVDVKAYQVTPVTWTFPEASADGKKDK